MNNRDYIRMSLELHLFFARIMKEHSFFLEVAFTDKNKDLKKIANNFQQMFGNILERAIILGNNNIGREVTASGEIVTNNTLKAENVTSDLSGVPINTNLTLMELNLKSGNMNITEAMLNDVSNLNKRTLTTVSNLIKFKNNILSDVLTCKMYTVNYPLLVLHIMNEAKMYQKLLTKVENREVFTKDYMYEQELFWNNIMKEHALFIRGLLDPTEENLVMTADNYAKDYDMIIKTYGNNPSILRSVSLDKTISFRDFKIAGEEGILNCKIKSIIIPLLADHVLREANHFIRLLNTSS